MPTFLILGIPHLPPFVARTMAQKPRLAPPLRLSLKGHCSAFFNSKVANWLLPVFFFFYLSEPKLN